MFRCCFHYRDGTWPFTDAEEMPGYQAIAVGCHDQDVATVPIYAWLSLNTDQESIRQGLPDVVSARFS